MNATWALSNDAFHLFETYFARIINLKCAPCPEAQLIDGKHDGIKEGLLGFVEGAVEEYIFTAVAVGHRLFLVKAIKDHG